MSTTVRELRRLLTAVEDQALTVQDLRRRLFDLDDQDQEATDALLIQVTAR